MADVMQVELDAAQRRLAETMAGAGPPNLIGGRWRPPTGTDTEEQFDPSQGATTGTLTYSSQGDVDQAVQSASAAQRAWAAASVTERVAPLATLGEAIAASRASLVPLIAIEVGKTLAEADQEVDLTCELVEILTDADRWDGSDRSPLGVTAGIALYHYPLLSPLWMVLPALTAGNGYVLRPCTWSPVTGVVASDLINGSGYPDGLFNVVHGSLDVVNHILRHPHLPAISYVGSGPWAQYMVDTGTANGKRVHAHGAIRQLHVVADDADPVTTARRVCRDAVGLAGQRWLAGCTVLAGPSIAPPFVDALCREAGDVRVGGSTDPATTMGPVIQRSRQLDLVDRVGDATDSVDVLVDGTALADGPGYFFGPTVIDHVPADHPLIVEQVPGPIISVVRAEPACATNLHHRDAHGTVHTAHGRAQPPDAASAKPTWLGPLPWDCDETIRFFTTGTASRSRRAVRHLDA